VIKNERKKRLQTHESPWEFACSPKTKQWYPHWWTSSILIIRIDESLNNHYFPNDHSMLNMWLGFSQKLGLKIKGYGFETPIPQTSRSFVGTSFLGHSLPRRGTTCGCWFSLMFIIRKHRFFWKFVIKKKHWFSWMFVTKKW